MTYWMTVGSLGDIAATMPIAFGIVAILSIRRAWRLAAWWILLFFFGLALVVISKIAFIGWGIGNQALDFTGFSGHATRAMAIFPVLGYLLTKKSNSSMQGIFFAVGVAAAIIVGISRHRLHMHSWSEIYFGWMVGATISYCFILMLRQWKHISLYSPVLMIALIPILVIPYIEPTPTQHWLIQFSLYLSGHDQPFTRERWEIDAANHGRKLKENPKEAAFDSSPAILVKYDKRLFQKK
jgi:membrane-associated phospholipid phosphatase